MKVHNRSEEAKGYGVAKDFGLIHSVETTSANLHDITRAAQLLHGNEKVVYGEAGYQGIETRAEISNKSITFRVAIMRPGTRRALPNTPYGRLLDLIETAKAFIRAKVEHPFRMIKQQFGFQKTRLRGMAKNQCKDNVLAALKNIYLAREYLLATGYMRDWCVYSAQIGPRTGKKCP